MPDSDARIGLARRIFSICNPPDTPQELFDNGTVADRTLYFQLADLTLEVAAGAVREYRTHQAGLEAALGEKTDGLQFPLAEGTPVLLPATVFLGGQALTAVQFSEWAGAGYPHLVVPNGALRPR